VEAIAATCPRERVLYVRRRHAIAPAARRVAAGLGSAGDRTLTSVDMALTAFRRAAALRLQVAARTMALSLRRSARRARPRVVAGVVLATEMAIFATVLLGELLLRLAIASARRLRALASFAIRRVRAALPERASAAASSSTSQT